MPTDYEKAHLKYRDLAAKSRGTGPEAKQAHADKAKAMNEIREIEREGARAGKVLTALYKGADVVTEVRDAPTQRSLMEEYVRKFDSEKTVQVGGKEQTLREYHSKRLLGK